MSLDNKMYQTINCLQFLIGIDILVCLSRFSRKGQTVFSHIVLSLTYA